MPALDLLKRGEYTDIALPHLKGTEQAAAGAVPLLLIHRDSLGFRLWQGDEAGRALINPGRDHYELTEKTIELLPQATYADADQSSIFAVPIGVLCLFVVYVATITPTTGTVAFTLNYVPKQGTPQEFVATPQLGIMSYRLPFRTALSDLYLAITGSNGMTATNCEAQLIIPGI